MDARTQEGKQTCRPVLMELPVRASASPGGVAFGVRTAGLDMDARQAAALAEILSGNVPRFLRQQVPVTLRVDGAGRGRMGGDSGRNREGPRGRAATATIWVSPDYLAIGSDADFLRWPFTWPAAQTLCRTLRMLPATARIADAVWAQATLQLQPRPIPPGPAMMSNSCFLEHQRLVEAQRPGRANGQLTAGHKKDVVLSGQLRARPGRVAIYGWHHLDGQPIQPLSTVHTAGYADYSHGLRLVHPMARVGDHEVAVVDALGDPGLAPLFSSEGVIVGAAALLGGMDVG